MAGMNSRGGAGGAGRPARHPPPGRPGGNGGVGGQTWAPQSSRAASGRAGGGGSGGGASARGAAPSNSSFRPTTAGTGATAGPVNESMLLDGRPKFALSLPWCVREPALHLLSPFTVPTPLTHRQGLLLHAQTVRLARCRSGQYRYTSCNCLHPFSTHLTTTPRRFAASPPPLPLGPLATQAASSGVWTAPPLTCWCPPCFTRRTQTAFLRPCAPTRSTSHGSRATRLWYT